MNNKALSIENLGKSYRIRVSKDGLQRRNLFGFLGESFEYVLENIRKPREDEILWALRNVSMEIRSGEVVGIIGANGAGKSTLLKLISRITEPTEGRITTYGRVSSLIEVGTGFHPDLTGRENVYVNGMMIGMSRSDLDKKYNAIVDFSEVGKFIDTPVKYYSSGMYVRLGFSIAAHLDPDVFIVDEVLAVGDASFRSKCLGIMDDKSNDGRTILYVSHNIPSIISLCTRCIWLDKGQIIADGPTREVTQKYIEHVTPINEGNSALNNVSRYGNGNANFTKLEINPINENGEKTDFATPGDDLEIITEIEAFENINEASITIIFYDLMGNRIIDADTGLKGDFLTLEKGAKARVQFVLHNLLLKPGKYRVGLWLGILQKHVIDGIKHAGSFTVILNPEKTLSSTIFPGVYQCQFTEVIELLPK